MKKIFFIVILSFVIACTKKVNRDQVSKEADAKAVVSLKANFVIQNQKLLSFIDSFIDKLKSVDSSDIDNNFYMLYIYQNDFFARVKLSFLSPTKALIPNIPLGTGYFEYKGRIFIVITGIERFCAPDSTLQNELQILLENRTKRNGRHIKNDIDNIELQQPFTWEADIVADTIFIREGTINPRNPPPADTAELYKYIRSIKSFTH
jgi:hypothetical protein